MLASIYSMSPPDGGAWERSLAPDALTCVRMPDGLVIQVPVGGEQTAAELLAGACQVALRLARCLGKACFPSGVVTWLTPEERTPELTA